MAKGDDIERRKKNKANRKKLNRKQDSSSVSARVASIIAAKKRRLSGKRRICQGMCFSLPTPDNPYNDQNDKKRLKENEAQRSFSSRVDKRVSGKGKKAIPKKTSTHDGNVEVERYEENVVFGYKQENIVTCISNAGQTVPINSRVVKYEQDGHVTSGCHAMHLSQGSASPSKYLITCLKAIENVLSVESNYNAGEDKHLLVNTWGVEFWKLFSAGNDILETSGSSVGQEQVAWMVSTAADAISRREKEGLSFANPFLLYLVPTKEKALKVRALCKPLKTLGIHTVGIHPGASLDHQINGLGSCEPEFLVSTPERLLELVSLKAINISAVAFLVIEGSVSLPGSSYFNATKSIRQVILKKPQTVVFSGFPDHACIHTMQDLLPGSVSRLSLNDSVASQTACIIQSINVCSSKEEKMVKGMNALNCAHDNLQRTHPLKVLSIVKKDSNVQKLISAINFKGSVYSGGRMTTAAAVATIDTDEIITTDLGEYIVVIIPDFVISMDAYVQILTQMARHTVGGVLQTFLTKDDARHAGPLIKLLEQCGQPVPEALRDLHLTSSGQ